MNSTRTPLAAPTPLAAHTPLAPWALAVGGLVWALGSGGCSGTKFTPTPGGAGGIGESQPVTGGNGTSGGTTGATSTTGTSGGTGCGPFDAGLLADNPLNIIWTLGTGQPSCSTAGIGNLTVEVTGVATAMPSCEVGNPADDPSGYYSFPTALAAGVYGVDVRAYSAQTNGIAFEGVTSVTINPATPGMPTTLTVPLSQGVATSMVCGVPN